MIAEFFGSSAKPVAKEGLSTQTVVNLSARTAQVFFSSGIIFSMFAMTTHASAVAAGGSFLFHGSLVLIRLLETSICYDLAKTAANVASIFESRFLLSWVEKSLGSKAANVVEAMESLCAPPESVLKNLQNSDLLAKAITHGTVFAHLLNPHIVDLLSKKPES